MRYSRLSASFIFIAQDTRAQTNSENFPERLLTRIYVVVVVVAALAAAAAARSKQPGRPVFAARHVSCLVDIYWRRLAAFPMMDFSANQTDRPTPPTCSVQTQQQLHFTCTYVVPTSRFSSLVSFICRWCVPEKTTRALPSFFSSFQFFLTLHSLLKSKGFPES